jgi:hypothetical protein
LFNNCTRLDQALAQAVRHYPQRLALQDEETSFNYVQLDQAVDQLCESMRIDGVRSGDRVGIYIAKSASAVVAIYAALRLGALVAPIDIREPVERSARMLVNADLDFLLASPSSRQAAEKVVDAHGASVKAHEVGELFLFPLPGQPGRHAGGDGGYVLFTSGSTGWPKGVWLSHANLLHFAKWAAHKVGLSCEDRVSSQTALTFDLSTFDLFSSALTGACLCLLPDYLKAFPRDVTRWLDKQRISVREPHWMISGYTGVYLGIATALLQHITEAVRNTPSQRESSAIQQEVGRLSAELHAGKALLKEAGASIVQRRGSIDANASVHAAKYFIGELAPKMAMAAVKICGASTLNRSRPLERLLRESFFCSVMPAKPLDCLEYLGKAQLGVNLFDARQMDW